MTLSSKLALPWCASIGMDTSRRTAARNAAAILFFIHPSSAEEGSLPTCPSLALHQCDKFFANISRKLFRSPLYRIEADLDGLLSGAMCHRIRFVHSHVVGKAFFADPGEVALNQNKVPGFHFMMKIDRQARNDSS